MLIMMTARTVNVDLSLRVVVSLWDIIFDWAIVPVIPFKWLLKLYIMRAILRSIGLTL